MRLAIFKRVMLFNVAFGRLYDAREEILDCSVVVLVPEHPREAVTESFEEMQRCAMLSRFLSGGTDVF